MRFLLLAVPVLGACAAGAAQENPASVRVRLESLAPTGFVARAASELVWCDGSTGIELARTPAGVAATVQQGDSIRVNWSTPGQLGSVAGDFLVLQAAGGAPVRLEMGSSVRVYPGVLELRREDRRLGLINQAPLEDYVRGVMACEVPSSFHPEALKAMAVAIRSYTLASGHKHGAEADLCDGTHCQVYRGVGRIPRSIEEAVGVTRDQCATYAGRPIEAVYSADCGGRTEAVENAWPGASPAPYLRPVDDSPGDGATPYCAVNPHHSWKFTVSREQLRRLAGAGDNLRIDVTSLSAGGHVRALSIFTEPPLPTECGPDDQDLIAADPVLVRKLTGAQWRSQFGSDRIRSMHFGVRSCPGGGAIVEGAGWGHGVGLCQFGAEGLARSPAAPTYVEILRHYYQGVAVGPVQIAGVRP